MKKTVRFIDCGANIGQSIDWSIKTLALASDSFDIKIDSFEPYPELFSSIEEKYSNFRSILKLHKTAVDIVDDKKRFYLQEHGARTSSSIYKSKESTYRNLWIRGDVFYKDKHTGQLQQLELEWRDPDCASPTPQVVVQLDPSGVNEIIHLQEFRPKIDEEKLYNWVDVDTIDMSRWLRESINPENEIVILKLDVEGSEYSILDKLLHDGLNKMVDVLLVEWTPETKIVSCKDIYGTKEERDNLKLKVNEKFKFVLDWHHPEECVGPLTKYLKNVL
jgi:hypothetical protein